MVYPGRTSTLHVARSDIFPLISLVVLLTGCGSVFDPSPYRPTVDNSVLNSVPRLDEHKPSYTSATLLQFGSLQDAAEKLQVLSDGFADERDDMMRQQLLFDLPMMGLAAGAIASGIYGGSKDLILGLGLGSASLAGGRAYFGPQGKVAAYNEAASALGCAEHFARGIYSSLSHKFQLDQEQARTTLTNLRDILSLAEGALIAESVRLPETLRATLLSARDRARKASTDLSSALDLLASAPGDLEVFAFTVVNATTTKIVSGSQNLDSALSLLAQVRSDNAAPISPSRRRDTSASRSNASAQPIEPTLTPSDIIITLNSLAADAETFANRVMEKWRGLTRCAVLAN